MIGVGGSYDLVLTDTNNCVFYVDYWIPTASDIFLNATVTPYGNYETKCNGDSTGEIVVNGIGGGFPDYTLLAIEETTGDTVYNQPVTASSGYSATIYNLPEGDYRLWAYDTVGCWNENPGNITYDLESPDIISITRDENDIKFHHDTVDISCFGKDDGFINLVVSGGHTADYENDYTWIGPDPDLIQDDSLQSSLSGGNYNVLLRDYWGCEDSADFTLYEPTQILLDVDSIRELNGWNITCFG